ncbi:hypothetical protein ACFFIX_17715 [Metabacillus herbersteinensis]|uniref:Uncharacterized protein n=1 Tax=Metabacillus herbersteinensis TaxID=283816 RepID=A0ABV6GHT7_9BACI
MEPHETKSKRARIVPLSSKTLRLLKEYMSITEDFEAEHLFLSIQTKPPHPNDVETLLADFHHPYQ